jgi:hypothetical protein
MDLRIYAKHDPVLCATTLRLAAFFHLHSFDLHMLGMQTDSMIAVELFYSVLVASLTFVGLVLSGWPAASSLYRLR